MTRFHCLIVDDEPLARELLTDYVAQLPSLSLVGCCADALAGLRVLHTQPVDLLFTDVVMPQLSGFDLLRSLTKPPTLILTTAFADYALEGFEVGAIDYLLKPFSFPRFVRAVDRALGRPPAVEPDRAPIPTQAEFVFLKVDKLIVKVRIGEIHYGQAYGNYVKLFLTGERMLLVSETMGHLEKLLPAPQFMRIHKSYLIALEHITGYQPGAVRVGTRQLPIGDHYRKQFQDIIGDTYGNPSKPTINE